jgi:hypothetical protein
MDRRRRAAPALRRSRHRPPGGAAARVPRVLVRLAPPAPRPRRRRLPGGRARPTRLQHLRQAAPAARLPTPAAGPGGGRPDRRPRRQLGRGRRARLGRRGPGLAAGHAGPRAHPATGGPQRAPPGPLPQGPGQPPPAAPQLVPARLPAPWLPERLLAARDFWALRRALGRQPTRPGAFTAQDIDRYVAAAAQPGALRAAVNYYRAAVRANPLALAQTVRRVDAPTLVIWGTRTATWAGSWPSQTMSGSRRCGSSGSPRPATGSRPTPPSGSTSSWWTSSSPSAANGDHLLGGRQWHYTADRSAPVVRPVRQGRG